MLIWADFPSGQQGLYGTSTSYMLNGVWGEVRSGASGGSINLVSDPDPNVGSAGEVLATFGGNTPLTGTGESLARFVHPNGAQTTVGIGFRLWMNVLPQGDSTNGNAMVWFRTASNSTVVFARVMADGSIGIYNSSSTLLGQTDPVITTNAYHHIEIKVLRDAAAGTVEVRVNGVAKLSLDTLALGASDIGMWAIGSYFRTTSQTTPTNYWKDVFFWDASGSEVNDFQGSVSVYDLLPDGDDTLNWTPSTGLTGWDLIDDNNGPDDADYISAADPPPAASIFSMANLPADVTSVRAVMSIGRMMKTDGGDCTVQMSLSPDGTNWDTGSDRPITTAFTYWWDTSHVSPATTAAWTPVEVDALEFRINRTL